MRREIYQNVGDAKSSFGISVPVNANKLKVVFVSGHFNVLHPGHLRLLRFAKECGDYLIVAVESDLIAGSAAHVPEQLRLEGIQSNSWVDEAFIMDEPLIQVLNRIRPDIIVKGKEHEKRFNPELPIVKEYGGRLLFSSGETVFSSVDLLRKAFYEFNSPRIAVPRAYMERHAISISRLQILLKSFSSVRVGIIGDLIVDEYITCQPLGMSQEDPTIVVTPIDSTRFLGGAAIVAAHAAGMGASVEFITVAGQDHTYEFAFKKLIAANVKAKFLIDDSRPTTLKQRFRSKGKSLLRVSYLHQNAISSVLQNKFLDYIKEMLCNIDLLVFSDFNYGCLPQTLVEEIISIAKKHDLILAADSQSSSQIGDISRFREMDLLTPTEREARISTRNHEDGLVVLAERLRQQSHAKNILLKLGEEGLLVHADAKNKYGWETDRIDALNPAPRDVAGAGDSLLIASALTLASGGSIWESACIGSLAAAVQVARVGNTPIRIEEMLQELEQPEYAI